MATKAVTKAVGKYQGHVIEAEVIDSDGRPGLKVLSWTLPDGKPAPAKATKGFVGIEFPTVNAAGIAAFKATHDAYGVPEKLEGRSLVFRNPETKDSITFNQPRGRAPSAEPKPAKAKSKAQEVKESNGKTSGKAKQAELPVEEAEVEVPVKKGKASPKASAEAAPKKARPRPSIYPMKATKAGNPQEGLAEGLTKFWCVACFDAFIAPSSPTPDACPNGHPFEEDYTGGEDEQPAPKRSRKGAEEPEEVIL